MFGDAHSRRVYFELARDSYDLWRVLEREADAKLLTLTGGLDITTTLQGRRDISALAHRLFRRSKSFDLYSAEALCREYPQWKYDPRMRAIYTPRAGILEAESCMAVAVSEAKKNHAEVKDNSQVVSVELGISGTIEVRDISGKVYRTRKLLITAGPWASNILRPFGVRLPLRISQEQVAYFSPVEFESFKPEKFPVWEWSGANFVYGFPVFERRGIKIAFHSDGKYLNDMTEFNRTPSKDVTRRLRSFLFRYLPSGAGEALEASTCVYTNTPDDDFIIDTVPRFPQIGYFAGCSGHAFHCAPALAKTLIELVFEGKTAVNISCLSSQRFLRLAA